jgi:soluble P-type ATPase
LLEIDVHSRSIYKLEHLVLDLNGTIALDGSIIEGIPEKLDLLRKSINITVVTADTRGTAQHDLGQRIGVKIHKVYSDD